MDSLPSELFTHILSFTTIRDRFVSRRVCKEWKERIEADLKCLNKVWFYRLRETDHDTRQDIINDVIRPSRSCHDREHSVSLLDILFVDDVTWLVEGILDRFITLCPNIKVIVVDEYSDEAFTRSLVYKYRHSLECIVEYLSHFYHPCKVPHLKHLVTQYMGEYDCMEKANDNYPSLEAITLSDFSGSADDKFWKSLKSGIKILAHSDNRGEYDYCPDLGHILASPAAETLETVAIGLAPNSHLKIGDDKSFPHVKSLQMAIQCGDWDQRDENGDIIMPETFTPLPNFRTIFPSVETFTFFPQWTEQRVLNQVLEHLMTRRRKGSRKQLETFRFIATSESKLEMLPNNCDFLPKNVEIVIQSLYSPLYSPQVLPILDKVLENVENLTITTHYMDENTITPLSIINFVKKHMVNGNLQSFIIERHTGSFHFSYKRMCNLRRLHVRNIFLQDIRGKAISLESPTTTPSYLYFSKIKKKE